MTLTKADLIQQVYKQHESLTKQKATEAVETFIRLSKDSLCCCGTNIALIIPITSSMTEF